MKDSKLKDFLARYSLPAEALAELRAMLDEVSLDELEAMPAPEQERNTPLMLQTLTLPPEESHDEALVESGGNGCTEEHVGEGAGAPGADVFGADDFSMLAQTELPQGDVARDLSSLPGEQTPSLPHITTTDPEALSWLPRDRYKVLSQLGRGGMGTVWRVYDRRLKRELALKAIRPELAWRESLTSRFVEEAQATSQLQHPGIVPVYDMESLPDGHCYFTMKIIEGQTLAAMIRTLHEASKDRSTWVEPPSGWGFRRLLEVFRRICEAVSYAHTKGVLHRDLKPDNVMLGEHGEVVVMDWGLVKVAGKQVGPLEGTGVITERAATGSHVTMAGMVQGTPAYMPPEQAVGLQEALGAHCDVYALGAILYELLAGRPPYEGESPKEVLAKVVKGELAPPGLPERELALGTRWDQLWRRRDEDDPELRALPGLLLQICDRAMALKPADRFPSATALGDAVGAWLEGRRQRESGLAIVAQAEALLPEAEALRLKAQRMAEDAALKLSEIGSWESEDQKGDAWALEDQAQALQRDAKGKEFEYERLLHASLMVSPELEEAHAALASMYFQHHKKAEASDDEEGVIAATHRLKSELRALPKGHELRRTIASYLDGSGRLSLTSAPSGAEVRLFRYERQGRRLRPVFVRTLGVTPLIEVPLPMGSYLLELHKDGHQVTQYPVHISRQAHWDATHPDGQPRPIWLPPEGSFESDDCYVPGGWFWSGGDPLALKSFPKRRIWLDDFVVRRHPITNRDFIAFLDDLVDRGEADEALRCAPCERPGTLGEQGPVIYGRDEQGHFVLRPDADGDLWRLDEPVIMVNWYSVSTYARWYAEKTGLPWRLCSEWEYEKAARGVDGRAFPWGDFPDPSWACTSQSHAGEWNTALLHEFPADCSPYGVRGLAGNVREWCGQRFEPADDEPPPAYVPPPEMPPQVLPARATLHVRGASWSTRLDTYGRAANRNHDVSGGRDGGLGFRLYRSLLGGTDLANR